MYNSKIFLIQIFGIAALLFFFNSNNRVNNKQNWKNVVPQSTSYSCGASSLQMVLLNHNIKISLKEIENSIITSSQGCSMIDLKKYCELKGLIARGWHLSFSDLEKLKMPVIVSMNKSHFIVVDRIKNDFVYCRDPLHGMLTIQKNLFVNKWDNFALETIVDAKYSKLKN